MDDHKGSSFLIPALSVIPPGYHVDTEVDRKVWHTSLGRDMGIMNLLDGLAAICTVNDDDIFVTAIDIASSTLYLASNHSTGVPESASNRVTVAINYMLTKAEELQKQPPSTKDDLRMRFIEEQFEFSGAALTARRQCLGRILDRLNYVLNPKYTYSTRAERSRAPSYYARFTDQQREFLDQLRAHVQSISQKSEVPDLYLALRGLSSLMLRANDEKLHKALINIGHAGDVPISYYVHRLLAIVDGIDAVLDASPELCGKLRGLHLEKLEPGTGTLKLDPDDELLRRNMARIFDGGAVNGLNSSFNDNFDRKVHQPLRAVLSQIVQDHGPAEDAIYTVALHPEVRMFQHVHDCVSSAEPYIGVSELSCVVCFDYIVSHDEHCGCLENGEVRLRGSSHVQNILPWGAPQLACGDNESSKSAFFYSLGTRFLASRLVFRQIARFESSPSTD